MKSLRKTSNNNISYNYFYEKSEITLSQIKSIANYERE